MGPGQVFIVIGIVLSTMTSAEATNSSPSLDRSGTTTPSKKPQLWKRFKGVNVTNDELFVTLTDVCGRRQLLRVRLRIELVLPDEIALANPGTESMGTTSLPDTESQSQIIVDLMMCTALLLNPEILVTGTSMYGRTRNQSVLQNCRFDRTLLMI